MPVMEQRRPDLYSNIQSLSENHQGDFPLYFYRYLLYPFINDILFITLIQSKLENIFY